MQSKPSNYSSSVPMKTTIYINPNFAASQLAAMSTTAETITTRPHINPLFQGRVLINPHFIRQKENNQIAQQQWRQQLNAAAAAAYGVCQSPGPSNVWQTAQATADTSEHPSHQSVVAAVHINPIRKLVRKTTTKSNPTNVTLATKNSMKCASVISRPVIEQKVSNVSRISTGQVMATVVNTSPRYKLDRRPRPAAISAPIIMPAKKDVNKKILNTSGLLRKNERRLRVVNINGVLYKSTYNKLQRNTKSTSTMATMTITTQKKNALGGDNGSVSKTVGTITRPATMRRSSYSLQNVSRRMTGTNVLYLNGNKYMMDTTGFKLTRISNATTLSSDVPQSSSTNISSDLRLRRIDIGGVTFIASKSANNVFLRTSHHLTRAHLNCARQRSLQLLSRRCVKNNLPCPIFQRLGKCAAFERNKCNKVHDRKHVLICPKFLRGECTQSGCLLSHTVCLSKMPVCRFFLQGTCVRMDCPYLHKKLNSTAEVCPDFLKGFCKLAQRCNKRHEFLCPAMEKSGKCDSKNCVICGIRRWHVLRHSSPRTVCQNPNLHTAEATSQIHEKDECSAHPSSICRYFSELAEKTNITNNHVENEDKPNDGDTQSVNDDNIDDTDVKTSSHRLRPKLGTLPAFIPLT